MPVAASPPSAAAGAAALGEGDPTADLVRRIAAGDELAEAELVRRYSRSLRFLLRRLCRDPELVEDLSQTTFSIVLERLRTRGLEDPTGLGGFVRGTARNLFRNEARKQYRRRVDETPPSFEEMPDTASPGSPLDQLLRSEKAVLVRKLLFELRSQRDREILMRVYLAEEEMEQVSRDLGLDLDHFYRVLYRARQRLKQLFEEHRSEEIS